MNFSQYFKTPLEQMIEDQYRANGLLLPADLTIEKIAAIFEVDVVYYDQGPFSDNEDRVIFLNRYENEITQRTIFFHELCHVVRHSGDQRWMPDMFREAQENDAERFSHYASIPSFMLQKFKLPALRSEAISRIAHTFRTQPEFAQQRLDHIQERIADEEFLTAFSEASVAKNDVEDDNEGLLPQRISAFYDYNDFSRPHTLVIEQREGFNWDEPLHIVVDGNYKSCNLPSYMSKESAPVLSGDLSVCPDRKGCLVINLSRVAWRHGKSASRLYLPMEAIDDAVNF
ncbi:ImmA/IrrE family metallo-endopeptidase [Paenibacillus monticola]|uniref:ImmA/IrrE family metallo-endopeptidase n=1 Tax=Paenibacillus monticola TaxID=2666075 RepID=A0A7X2HAZ7_9BACL|nr:ImmA/IrrE family metallo-endopeptidase [Paenibacillus monticola]MRN56788.1 ImmA/IrrE family metallo-endopeptidase [Paenibacillus monticola]